jgi:hypothetical protein
VPRPVPTLIVAHGRSWCHVAGLVVCKAVCWVVLSVWPILGCESSVNSWIRRVCMDGPGGSHCATPVCEVLGVTWEAGM